MNNWVEADDFIEADIIRWTGGIFEPRRRGKKSLCIGECLFVAEVLQHTDDGWLHLLILACTVTRDNFAGKTLPIPKPQTQIRRAATTILRGKPERLLWSDEEARASVVWRSKFLPA